MRNKTLKCFTLAEVLITLGIIGIVAALTIPALLNNIANAQLKTAFKKAYSIASQDWEQVASENSGAYNAKGGWSCTWPDGTTGDFSAADGKVEDFKSKMKVIKTCVGTTGCWPDEYEFATGLLGNNKTGEYSPYSYSWINADGMCWSSPFKGIDDAHLLLDTNCNKKPNKIGEDIFSMFLGADGVVYFAIDDTSTTGKPVSSGHVCPWTTDPATVNGRSISFKSWL